MPNHGTIRASNATGKTNPMGGGKIKIKQKQEKLKPDLTPDQQFILDAVIKKLHQ